MQPEFADPFYALSAIAGPALLTNATSLLILSTTGRFARAVDRTRVLVEALKSCDEPTEALMRRELVVTQTRVHVVVRAISALYASFGLFALATMLSLVGMVAAAFNIDWIVGVDAVIAAIAGLLGFAGLTVAAIGLITESQLAMRALRFEGESVQIQLGKRNANG